MKRVDTLIINGEIVDGTGRPRYQSDVAILDGLIVEVGTNLSERFVSEKVINAKGKIVCPGFVDCHTHYDGQITWDPILGPSTEHGVTTVCFGNCKHDNIAPDTHSYGSLTIRTPTQVAWDSRHAERKIVKL